VSRSTRTENAKNVDLKTRSTVMIKCKNCFYLTGVRTCRDDPLMYFPFADDFNDIQCHKVKGTEHGDTKLREDLGCIELDGDGDYVSVSNASRDIIRT